MAYQDLREFMDILTQRGELKVCRKEVDTKIEIAKVTDKASKIGGPAILFTNVKGFKVPVLTGLFNTLDRAFLMIDSTKYNGYLNLARGLDSPISPVKVSDGPCKEIIVTGDKVNLYEIPVLWHHQKDSHHFITTASCRVKDPDTGICNSSINRLAVQSREKLSIQSTPPHALAGVIQKYITRRMKCQIAIAVGMDPAILVGSACGIPPDIDEFAYIGGVRGAPVEVVKCAVLDLEVPARAELIIEGEIVPGEEDGFVGKTEYAGEGPFAEVHGYFGGQLQAPVIQVKAITHRKDYIYHGMGTAEPPSEHQVFDGMGLLGGVYVTLSNVIPKEHIKSINANCFGAVVSIHKKYPGQARQIIQALLAKVFLKRVIVVDADIDVFNPIEVDWAVQFRSGPEDYIFTADLPAIPLDPMITRLPNMLRKVGIDATLPVDGDKSGRVEILKDLGTARYPSLNEVDLRDYIE